MADLRSWCACLLVGLSSLGAATGCSSSPSAAAAARCDPDALGAEVGGTGAIDCGRVAVGEDPREAWACAIAAWKSGKPFRIREDRTGIDSTITVVVAGGSDGRFVIVSRDSDPTGGSGAAPSVSRTTCPTPVIERSPNDGIERLNCSAPWTTERLCP